MDESINKPQETIGIEAVPNAEPALESPGANSSYLKIVDNARIAVAITSVVCGICAVIFNNCDDYFTVTLRREPGIWMWGKWIFGIGFLACLAGSLILIIEYLARPATPKSIKFLPIFFRSVFMIIAIAAISYLMLIFYGCMQAVGATIGIFLLLAALKNDYIARVILAVLALIVLCPTLLSTQSTYQYACKHADEIVSAGCEMMDQWPQDRVIDVNRTDQPLPGPLPRVLRKLGVQSIFFERDFASLYVPGTLFSDREFMIYRTPDPEKLRESVFIRRPTNKDMCCQINDRLWMTDY
jgi:hypothetical protein